MNKLERYQGVIKLLERDLHESYEHIGLLEKELAELKREYAEERAAHNAHVTELCELEKENRKMREDIERIIEILKNGQQAHWQTFKIRQLLGVTVE